jgi:hypothetical protein
MSGDNRYFVLFLINLCMDFCFIFMNLCMDGWEINVLDCFYVTVF